MFEALYYKCIFVKERRNFAEGVKNSDFLEILKREALELLKGMTMRFGNVPL